MASTHRATQVSIARLDRDNLVLLMIEVQDLKALSTNYSLYFTTTNNYLDAQYTPHKPACFPQNKTPLKVRKSAQNLPTSNFKQPTKCSKVTEAYKLQPRSIFQL